MKTGSRFSLIILSCLACVVAYGQSAVGTWNGRMDMSGVKPKDAKEKAQLDTARKMVGSMSLRLIMKGNKTFTVTVSGIGTSKPFTQDGKWSQSGRTVTMTDKSGKPQNLTISANGRQMTMTTPSGSGGPKGVKMTFTRA